MAIESAVSGEKAEWEEKRNCNIVTTKVASSAVRCVSRMYARMYVDVKNASS